MGFHELAGERGAPVAVSATLKATGVKPSNLVYADAKNASACAANYTHGASGYFLPLGNLPTISLAGIVEVLGWLVFALALVYIALTLINVVKIAICVARQTREENEKRAVKDRQAAVTDFGSWASRRRIEARSAAVWSNLCDPSGMARKLAKSWVEPVNSGFHIETFEDEIIVFALKPSSWSFRNLSRGYSDADDAVEDDVEAQQKSWLDDSVRLCLNAAPSACQL